MAIKWGNIITGTKSTRKGKIGIEITTSNSNTATTVTIKIYFASMYSLSDTNNSFYYNKHATSATTLIGSKTIDHDVNTGSGWSSSNQTLLATYTDTVTRTTSAQTKNYAAKITGIDNLGSSNVSSVYGSASIPALTSYTVSYNANGGSGAPSSQTKWYGKTLTLSSTKPTRTGYSFLGWNSSSTATGAQYAAGGSYTANAKVTLYAIWKANTYTVSYNANGGSGAPGNQTKTYGVTLKLSTTIPTRTNYNFKGWATSKTGSVAYAAGANYTGNVGVTLYAVWELAYVKPRITSFSVDRCDSNGTTNDEGTYALVKFNWACDRTVSSITIKWKLTTESSYSHSATVSASGTSGSVTGKIVGSGTLDADHTYEFYVTVADSGGSTYKTVLLTGTKFIIDILAGGDGIAFGKPAELVGVADIGFQVRFYGGMMNPVIGDGTDLNDVKIPNTYAADEASTNGYMNCPITTGTSFTLEVMSAGSGGQLMQRITSCTKTTPKVYIRHYHSSAWGAWVTIH